MSEAARLGPCSPVRPTARRQVRPRAARHTEAGEGEAPSSAEAGGGGLGLFLCSSGQREGGQACGPFPTGVTALPPPPFQQNSLPCPPPPHPLLTDNNAGSDMI